MGFCSTFWHGKWNGWILAIFVLIFLPHLPWEWARGKIFKCISTNKKFRNCSPFFFFIFNIFNPTYWTVIRRWLLSVLPGGEDYGSIQGDLGLGQDLHAHQHQPGEASDRDEQQHQDGHLVSNAQHYKQDNMVAATVNLFSCHQTHLPCIGEKLMNPSDLWPLRHLIRMPTFHTSTHPMYYPSTYLPIYLLQRTPRMESS